MKENETIAKMVTKFTDITNSFVALRKKYTHDEKIRKILCALTSDWEKKTTTVEEANDLSTISFENLIGNLMAYEVQLEDRKKDEQQLQSKKQVLAYHTFSDLDSSDDDEDEIDFKKVQNFFETR